MDLQKKILAAIHSLGGDQIQLTDITQIHAAK